MSINKDRKKRMGRPFQQPILTEHVYQEDSIVYVKEELVLPGVQKVQEQWSPINFYWKSDYELKENLMNHFKI
ncbi:hypothetical protein [Allomuricauda sp. ARW1Y1]|jgi:hypothetical protein|uniref:hypothetical protein n=1 Tax=Allomuricauda sp. ARW1Y1 TaxID=2663843 RepID=UPI0015CEF0BE|nr:hypothetical protein [Muricauda sp. ARW1Y1]NYJ28642.1 hypothetical protein [Muricauda sp. ARW1Y1]